MESCGWSHLDDDNKKTLEKDWEKLDWKVPQAFLDQADVLIVAWDIKKSGKKVKVL